jgi:putative heme-binding domain-containing protein
LLDDESSIVRLQLALSLGESSVDSALSGLAHLARQYGNETWLDGAILSSLGGRCGQMLMTLLEKPTELGQARGLIARLCSAVATRREPKELSTTIENIAVIEDRALQQKCLQGLLASLKSTTSINLTQSARDALAKLAVGTEDDIRISALELTRVLQLESSSERAKRLKMTFAEVRNLQLPVEKRLAAVRGLSAERDVSIATALLRAYPAATPTLRREILKSAFARRENLVAVIDALEQKIFEASALNTIQRNSLLEHPDANIAARAKKVLAVPRSVDERTVKSFLAALAQKRDPVAGRKIFSLHCALCHQAHGIGFAVGPDLSSEFRRAEQTMVHDILAPSDKIVAGHETYTIETNDGRITVGILAHESAGSLTLSLPGGQRVDLLRKDIRSLKSLPISLMPESLREALSPGDVANVISWLKKPPLRRVLFDDDPGFIDLLKEGSGTATIVTSDTYSGSASLRLTPPQRYSVRIPGWEFAIRENPGPGEYRYLRLAWKSPKGNGILIELADNGSWPAADSPKRRYFSGKNTTPWKATQVAAASPSDWTVVTRDLWKDFGDFTLTGIAPTAMGGPVWFDQIELLQEK